MNDLRDFSWYKGNLLWLPKRTIFLTKHGSHAYGTNIASSDLDIKGIAIAPKEYYLGFNQTFEQVDKDSDIDAVIYDIRKFWKLAADCNPNIIEVLFTDQRDWILEHPLLPTSITNVWWHIYDNRHLFLSQKAQHTFSGYAIAQLKRIQTHRSWLLNPPKGQPQRIDFGLKNGDGTLGKEQLGVINSRIQKLSDTLAGNGLNKAEVEEMDESLIENVVLDLELDRDLVKVIFAERRYASAARYWDAYKKWQAERNPKRAELEAKFGYDTKHAMHLVRLLRMAKEILLDGQVLVKRPDAEDLLRVRAGEWSYDQLVGWAKQQEVNLKLVAQQSKLPKSPNRTLLDKILVRTIEMTLD
jgi:predicted nucleotidyltransferase